MLALSDREPLASHKVKDRNLMSFPKIQVVSLLALCMIALTSTHELFSETPKSIIQILSLTPAPNYPRTTDALDIQQLTDGALETFPMWSRKGAVGWARTTPVVIKLKVTKPGTGQDLISGLLRLHTAKQVISGVTPPKRIDIYAETPLGGYSRITGNQIQTASLSDKTSHWIELAVNGAGPVLLVVLHADSDYVFLDEIQWVYTSNTQTAKASAVIVKPENVVADSLNNLKQSFLSSAAPAPKPSSNLGEGVTVDPIMLWGQAPWDQFDPNPNRQEILSRKGEPVLLFGTKDELESGCVGILNTSPDPKNIVLKIEQKSNNQNGIQLRAVKEVLAANGNLVPDALVPMGSGDSVLLSPGIASYFWITADLSKYCCGTTELVVHVTDVKTDVEFQLPIQIAVADYVVAGKQVHAVNWGYSTDKPIWSNPPAVVNDLVTHGINVFVIPPWIVPQPTLNGAWDMYSTRRFAETVTLFRNRGTLLLYMGWNISNDSSNTKLAWVYANSNKDDLARKNAMRMWLTTLVSELDKLGFSKNDWALYPVDEARGEDLSRLERIAAMVKGIDPSIRIYANPDSTSDTSVTHDHLESLKSFVDIWQPNLLFAASTGKDFFQNLRIPWWIYSNAATPAKTASPLNHYRAMSWKAWTLGAEGVGFWSYSDTAGTSAWDDLDGTRPDWAVVYEGAIPTSSRRWEAFREGLEDHRLLQSAVTDNPRLAPSEKQVWKTQIQNLTSASLTTARLQQVRLQLIRQIQTNFALDIQLDTP